VNFVHYDAILTDSDDIFTIRDANCIRLSNVTNDDIQKLLSITVSRNVTLMVVPRVESEE